MSSSPQSLVPAGAGEPSSCAHSTGIKWQMLSAASKRGGHSRKAVRQGSARGLGKLDDRARVLRVEFQECTNVARQNPGIEGQQIPRRSKSHYLRRVVLQALDRGTAVCDARVGDVAKTAAKDLARCRDRSGIALGERGDLIQRNCGFGDCAVDQLLDRRLSRLF